MSKYIAFDVETPNEHNNRMSAIGISVIENGMITDTFYTYVNPETYFADFNIALTGITPQAVESSPTFGQLWNTIEPIMNSGILIAHNAAFDMKVLSKCLNDYGISTERYRDYACTVQMGRKCFPELENHKLNTLCDYLGITLDHHQADSDSNACGELLIRYMEEGLDVKKFIRRYDLAEGRTVR